MPLSVGDGATVILAAGVVLGGLRWIFKGFFSSASNTEAVKKLDSEAKTSLDKHEAADAVFHKEIKQDIKEGFAEVGRRLDSHSESVGKRLDRLDESHHRLDRKFAHLEGAGLTPVEGVPSIRVARNDK